MTCNFCHSSDYDPFIKGRDRLHGIKGDFSLVRCKQCGLIYLNPRPSSAELNKYYPDDYHPFTVGMVGSARTLQAMISDRGITQKVNFVNHLIGLKGQGLDVGCATGEFIDRMSKSGWEMTGLEPSEYASRLAMERYRVKVITNSLEKCRLPVGKYDLVTLWDVLEHLQDPRAGLLKIRKSMKAGGWLVLSIPNIRSWDGRFWGKYWLGWDIPRHLTLYGFDSIRQLLNQSGFEFKKYYSFSLHHTSFVFSFSYWLTDRSWSTGIKSVLSRFAGSPLMRVITYPYYLLADRFLRSSDLIVVARSE